MSPRGLMTTLADAVTLFSAGCGLVRRLVAHQPAAALQPCRGHGRWAMALGQLRWLVSVTLVAAFLTVGVASHAIAATDKEYSQEDCDVIQSIEIDSSSGSGYYGATARNASKAFAAAADDVEDEGLQAAFGTLSKVYGAAGRARGAIAAAKSLAKAGKSYTKALETWTGALGSCAKSSLGRATSTTESDDE